MLNFLNWLSTWNSYVVHVSLNQERYSFHFIDLLLILLFTSPPPTIHRYYNCLPCYWDILSRIRMRMLYNSILEGLYKLSNYYDVIFWYVESRRQDPWLVIGIVLFPLLFHLFCSLYLIGFLKLMKGCIDITRMARVCPLYNKHFVVFDRNNHW